MIETNSALESTHSREAMCLGLAVGLHALLLLWNPTLLSSDIHQTQIPLVEVTVVDQSVNPGGGSAPAPEKHMGLMDTLKNMLIKPAPEEIAHVSPEPVVPRVAAPMRPALQERNMPRPIATQFQPKSEAEDLAMANAPNPINSPNHNLPTVPIGGPTLKTKAFVGIRTKELPFAVGGEDQLASAQSVIPVAVGRGSAKDALGYSAPSLNEAKGHHAGIMPTGSGSAAMNSIGAGAPSTIELSGTGGTGNAPTGAASGSSLKQRAGTGGFGNGGFGTGSGRGYGGGSGTGGIPGSASDLDKELSSVSGASGAGAKTKKGSGFELTGPLNNRGIVHKVIPQYPAWAEEQGIIGSVRLYFTVTPEGTVRTNIRVTKTTGYPQLDQLGIDALKKWQFAPLSAADEGKGEWGIITFNFSLSS